MQYKFIGKWKCNDELIEITNKNKTYMCSFERANIGIIFRNSLVVSEFDVNVQVGGVGVYSPIGDGSSNFALWSSTKITGLLGSGIALKSDESAEFIGEYSVKYFVRKNEAQSFKVKIEYTENKEIYKLSWYINEQKMLHGIGAMIDDSLAFAWGSTNCKFDFDIFTFFSNDYEVLKTQTVKWDDTAIHGCDFTRTS